ncbi:NmrA family protein [Mycobacterium sp. PO1]|nr:NmrA family protein [Mycobacterium sp. PO1]
MRTALTAVGDSRAVVADPEAKYWGIELGERTLLPGPAARLFATRFEDWIVRAAARG